MRTATMADLGLIDVPVPFAPRYMAKDGYGGWSVFDSHPRFENGFWVNGTGDAYEIGIYEENESDTPAMCRELRPEDSLFCISDAK